MSDNKLNFLFSAYNEQICEVLHIFEVLGIQTNFEKIIVISLNKMKGQSDDMIIQLDEDGE